MFGAGMDEDSVKPRLSRESREDIEAIPLPKESTPPAIVIHNAGSDSQMVRRAMSERKRRVSQSAEFVDLLVSEDLGVAFAMRVASKAKNFKPLPNFVHRSTPNSFLEVNPECEDGHARWVQKRSQLRKTRSTLSSDMGFHTHWAPSEASSSVGLSDRFEGLRAGCRSFLVFFLCNPEKLLLCSAAISGFYVMAALGVEPNCIPPEAGSVFDRVRNADSRFKAGAIAILAHWVASVIYSAGVLGARLYRIMTPQKPKVLEPGDLTLISEEVQTHELLKPSLWLELLAFVGVVAECVHLTEAEGGVPSVAQWVMLLQVLKCWRIVQKDTDTHAHGSLMMGFAKVLFSLAVFANVMTTMLFVIGTQEAYYGLESWLNHLPTVNSDERDTCLELYIEGWYFAVLSLTSVGYGDYLYTPLERGINSFWLLFSQLYTAKVCADLTWITSTHNHWEANFQARRAQAYDALQHMRVPRVLTDRVIAFQTYLARVHREDLMQPAFEGLSKNLMMELRLCAYRKLVLRAPFLRQQPKDVMTFIVGALNDCVFLPSDVIVRAGDKGRELFFIRRGKAQVYVGADPPVWGEVEPVVSYEVGNYFGELAMLTGHPRKAWIMAAVYSVCSVLPYSAVEELMHQYPGAFTSLVQAMVHQYNLQSSMTWEQVSDRLEAKCGFTSNVDAFTWFCSYNRSNEDDELGAKAFEESLARLKVPSLDRKILWAQIDADNSGFVTLEEFSEKVKLDAPESFSREMSSNSIMTGRDQDNLVVPRRMASFSRGISLSPEDGPPLSMGHMRPSIGQSTPQRVITTEVCTMGSRETVSTELLVDIKKELQENRDAFRRLSREIHALKTSMSKTVDRLPGAVASPPP